MLSLVRVTWKSFRQRKSIWLGGRGAAVHARDGLPWAVKRAFSARAQRAGAVAKKDRPGDIETPNNCVSILKAR